MKQLNVLILAVLVGAAVNAQEAQPKKTTDPINHFSLGFQLNHMQQDFSYGFSATSPYFADHRVALRVKYNLAWHEGVLKGDSISNWYQYSTFQIGTIGVGGMIGKSIRTYGSGGVLIVVPGHSFSTEKTRIGGYGVWGFEFLVSNRISYYIELGGAGIGARADRMISKPVYSNGFITTVGMHVYL